MDAIQTDRLIIRNFGEDDWRDLHEMILQYQASEYAQYDHEWPTAEEKIQEVTHWFSEGDSYLAVCLQSTHKLIGFVAQNERKEEGERAYGLGYVFNFDYHRQGYATEACRAAIERAFCQLRAEQLVTGTAAENLPSRRLLARLGLRETAPDAGTYVLTRDEWLERRLASDEAAA